MPKWLFLSALLAANVSIGQVLVTGNIRGLADEPVTLIYGKDFFGTEVREVVPVKDGHFAVVPQLVGHGLATVRYKGKDLKTFLFKGADSLNISFEADFLDGDVTFTGDGGHIHLFMDTLEVLFGHRLSLEWLNGQTASASNIDGLEITMFQLRNKAVKAMEGFNGQHPMPASFMSWFRNHLGHYYYLSLFRFASSRSAASSLPKATEIPKVMLEGISPELLARTADPSSAHFRELLLEYVDYRALEQYEFVKFADRDAAALAAWSLVRDLLGPDFQGIHLASLMLRDGESLSPSLLRRMNAALEAMPDSDAYGLVGERLKARLEAKDVVSVEEAKPTERLTFRGLDGKEFGMGSLRGKVVYMDVWASWCGPCRQQFPHAKALKEQFSKKELKDIVFLYVSIDNAEDAWRKAIEQLGIEGLHGFSPGGWGAPITSEYGINSIPRYLIFDRKGQLTHPNAPRPSDPSLPALLRQLMAQ